MTNPFNASQSKDHPVKYRKCKACKGTGYSIKEKDNPIFAGVCRVCQGMRVIGKKRKLGHVPQYAR